MGIFKLVHSTLFFLLELVLFISLGFTGYKIQEHPLLKILLAFLMPAIAIAIWGFWAAPRSAYRLEYPYRILMEITLFVLTSYLLYAIERVHLAFVFLLTALILEGITLYQEK